MKALIVYESMFGNTRCIAEAVAAGLAETGVLVEVVEAGAAPDALLPDVGLLVVGGPTHAFGLSRPSTRRSAAQWRGSSVTSIEAGLREWLGRLTPVGRPVAAGVFDTRVRWPPVPGSAARAAQRTLRAKGCRPVGRRSFWVAGTPGPVQPGEVDRARAWGAEVARRARATAPTART